MPGVILYGPPAAGKDTVTRELSQLDAKYVLSQRLKAGPGRTTGYRMTSLEEIALLRDRGQVVYENHRYGAIYLLDREFLVKQLAESVPVLHLGQVDGIASVRKALPDTHWLVVSLWCPREVAAERIASRRTNDDAQRLAAWDATESVPADLSINTHEVSATEAANQIDSALEQLEGGSAVPRKR